MKIYAIGNINKRQLYVHKSCVMLTKCVFLRFSKPGNSLSKFCASDKTFWLVSIMSGSCD